MTSEQIFHRNNPEQSRIHHQLQSVRHALRTSRFVFNMHCKQLSSRFFFSRKNIFFDLERSLRQRTSVLRDPSRKYSATENCQMRAMLNSA